MNIHKKLAKAKTVGYFLREVWYLIKSTLKTVPLFLLIYSLVNIVATNALVQIALRVVLRANNVTYIGPDNLVSTLTSPASIAVALILCLMISVLSIAEISGVMHAYSMTKIGKTPTLAGMLGAGIEACKKSFYPKNWAIILFIMVLVPLTGFYSLSFASLSAVIPDFVADFIIKDSLYSVIYRSLFALLFLIEISFIFAMNFYFLEDSDFISACKKSKRLISKKYIFTALCLAIASIILSIAVTAFSAVISSFVVKAISFFTAASASQSAAHLTNIILVVNTFLALIIAPGINIATLTVLFFDYLEEKNQMVTLSANSFKNLRPSKALTAILSVLLIISALIYADTNFQNPLFTSKALERPQIVAHRGDSVNAPENTMAAFEMALLEKPDWVELDVHQTKDGVIVVSHDDDLSRVSGKKLFVHALTYSETKSLDVGSWFSEQYSYLRLSTLDEALKLLKGKTRVQIEIKYTGFDSDLEEHVLEVIERNDMHDEVIITSLQDAPLKRIKELDPSMITTYSMYVAWKNIEDVECADYFTVEMSNITEELVHNVHAKGGKIFAWTVNNEDDVQYLVDCGVDGILTDNPLMLKDALDRAHYTNGIAKVLRRYLHQLSEF